MALGPGVPFPIVKNVYSEDFGKLYLIYRYMDLDIEILSMATRRQNPKICFLCKRLTIISLSLGCVHLYCVHCLDILIRYFGSQCFRCKKRFSACTLYRNTDIEIEMGEMISRCPNYFWAGCTLRLKLKDLPRHIRACELTEGYREARNNDLSSDFPSVLQLNFDTSQQIEFSIDYINRKNELLAGGLPDYCFNIEGPIIKLQVSSPDDYKYNYTVNVQPRYNFKTGKIGLKFTSNAAFRQVIKAPFPTVTYVIRVPRIQVRRMETEELSDLVMYGLEEDYFIPMGQEKYIRVVEQLFNHNITLNLENQLHYESCLESKFLTAIARTQLRDSVQIVVIIDPTPAQRRIRNGTLKFEIEDYIANVNLISKGFIDRIVSPNFFTSARGYRVKAELFVDTSGYVDAQTLYVNILSGGFDDRLRRQNGFLVTVALLNLETRGKREYIEVFAQVVYDNPIRVDIIEPLNSHLINSDLEIKIFVQEVHNDSNYAPANYFLDFKNFAIKSWNVLVMV